MTLYLRHLRGSENGEAESYYLERVCIGRRAAIYRHGDTVFVTDTIKTSDSMLTSRGGSGSMVLEMLQTMISLVCRATVTVKDRCR